MMMKKYIISGMLYGWLLSLSLPAFAATISGNITPNKDWKNVVYLLEMQHYDDLFSGSDRRVVDSCRLDISGNFIFKNIKPNSLYRLNVIPVNQTNPGAFIQDGVQDNYTFVATSEYSGAISFHADISRLLFSAAWSCSDAETQTLNEAIAKIIAIKMPVYDSMKHYSTLLNDADANDTAKIHLLTTKAISSIQGINSNTNNDLIRYLNSINNKNVLGLGLVYYGFQSNIADSALGNLLHLPNKREESIVFNSITDYYQSLQYIDISELLNQSFDLPDENTFKLSDIKSHYVLLDFWASWCLPCRKAIRGKLKQLGSGLSPEKLTIIGVNIDSDQAAANQAVDEDENPFLQIYDPEGKLKQLFSIEAIPFYILINMQDQSYRITTPEFINMETLH